MSNSVVSYFGLIFIGIGATVIMDLWGLFLKHAFKIAPSNMGLLGRWLLYMPQGIFRHTSIGSATRKSGECAVGWIAHYLVGILFAIAFVTFVGSNWLRHPVLIPALGFGLVTVSMPFFIMQPAFGLGFVASKTSNPNQARLRSLMNHSVFGMGIYLSGLFLHWLTWIFS